MLKRSISAMVIMTFIFSFGPLPSAMALRPQGAEGTGAKAVGDAIKIAAAAAGKTISKLLDDLKQSQKVLNIFEGLLRLKSEKPESMRGDGIDLSRGTAKEIREVRAAEQVLKAAVDFAASKSILIIDENMQSGWLEVFLKPLIIHGSLSDSQQEINFASVTILPSATEEIRKQYDLVIERQANGDYSLITASQNIPVGNEAELDNLKSNLEKQIDVWLSV